jgi:hypothetical protein
MSFCDEELNFSDDDNLQIDEDSIILEPLEESGVDDFSDSEIYYPREDDEEELQ